MDCNYEGTEGLQPFPANKLQPEVTSRPKSIYAFITSPEVAEGCKLPTALLKAEAAAEAEARKKKKLEEGGDGEGDGSDGEGDGGEGDNNLIENNDKVVNGDQISMLDGQPSTPKVTRVYENKNNKIDENKVHQSPNDENANKVADELSQATFGAGSSAFKAAISTTFLMFCFTVVLCLFASILQKKSLILKRFFPSL